MYIILFLLSLLCVYLLLKILSLKIKVKYAENMQYKAEKYKDEVIEKHNEVVRETNKLIRQNKLLKLQVSTGSTASSSLSAFTAHELRQLKFYLHPDKTSGKTHDLFIRINQLGK